MSLFTEASGKFPNQVYYSSAPYLGKYVLSVAWFLQFGQDGEERGELSMSVGGCSWRIHWWGFHTARVAPDSRVPHCVVQCGYKWHCCNVVSELLRLGPA